MFRRKIGLLRGGYDIRDVLQARYRPDLGMFPTYSHPWGCPCVLRSAFQSPLLEVPLIKLCEPVRGCKVEFGLSDLDSWNNCSTLYLLPGVYGSGVE